MPPAPPFDYSSLEAPSDNLTLGRLRALRLRPLAGAGAAGPPSGFDIKREADHLLDMQEYERRLAGLAFAERVGDPAAVEEARLAVQDDWSGQRGGWDEIVREAREALASHYVRYGAADGPGSARELVRRLEAAGAAQAPAGQGRSAPR